MARSSVYVLVAMLLAAWLLVSSVHLIQPTVSGASSHQKPSGGGVGPSWQIRLPVVNASTFQLPQIHLPNLHLHLAWPSFKFPGFGGGFGGGSGGGLGTGINNGNGGNQGSATGTGAGGSGDGSATYTRSATTTLNQPILIPRELLFAMIIIALILGGVAFVARARRKPRDGEEPKRKLELKTVQLTLPKSNEATENLTLTKEEALSLLGEEKVAEFSGWGSEARFLRPRIREDLPLIWGLDSELQVDAPLGSSLSGRGSEEIKQIQDGSFSVVFKDACNLLRGKEENQIDDKWVRAVKYDEDVVKHFRLNLLEGNPCDTDSKTAREIVRELAEKFPARVLDESKLSEFTSAFERVFYGKKKPVSREDYESFLLALEAALSDPKVIICGPAGQQQEKQPAKEGQSSGRA